MARSDLNPSIPQSSSKKKRTEDESVDASKSPIQLQRRRVWRACESCRRKKIKCDGNEPQCHQCASSNSQCTWLQTKDRAALSRHYVQELEARLLHMESIFTQLAPLLEEIAPPPSTGASSSQSAPLMENMSPDKINRAASYLRSMSKDKSPPPPSPGSSADIEVSDSFGQLALDEYGHMRWIGGSSTMSLIQSFKALTSAGGVPRYSPMEDDPHAPGPSVNKLYFPASVFFGKVRALPGPEEVEYPDRDLADKLVDAYFARFHFLLPVIDKPSFMKGYQRLITNTHDPNIARTETAFVALVFAVFACAANFVEDPRLSTGDRMDDGGMGMVYYERALILQYISHARIQPAHVQCFILLSSFLTSINCLPQAWVLVGQAVRTGQDVGLHRSPRRLQISPLEKELRRKIWWGVYTLDRMLAVALGRPIGINDADCDVEYPIEVDDDQLQAHFNGELTTPKHSTSLMTGFVSLIKLYQLAGRVIHEVYALDLCKDGLEPEQKSELAATVEGLDQELTRWCDNLPPALKTDHQTNEQVSMASVLCSHYYSVLTTLHRNLLPLKHGEVPIAPKSTIKAVSSARSCIRLAPSMKNVVPYSHHLAFFLQHLFSSSVILLLYSMHAPDQRASFHAMEEAQSSLAVLESWEGFWPGARKCKELLQELSDTARDAALKRSATESFQNIVPTSAPPSAFESRHHHSLSAGGVERTPKRRASRNRSETRRLSGVSPYRGNRRARSSSQRRQNGEQEKTSIVNSASVLSDGSYQPFPTPSAVPSGSPHSLTIPSPQMSMMEESRDGNASPLSSNNPFNYSSPISPNLPHATTSRYNYDYVNPPSTISQGSWNENNASDNNLGGYNASQDISYINSFGSFSPINSQFSYEPSDVTFNGGLATTLPDPNANFPGPGLPFRGLEYIRNLNSDQNGSFSNDQDTLWPNASYDPVAFEYNPDLPFNFGDGTHSGA